MFSQATLYPQNILFSMLLILYCTLFLLCLYCLLLLFLRKGWRQLQEADPAGFSVSGKVRVSILIPARNEEENIAHCLNAIFQNNYPAQLLEVIVIDDFSTDTTFEIASAILQNKKGKVIRLKNELKPEERLNSYKKKALEIAVGQASGEVIITTDADCICTENWVRGIVSCYEKAGAKFIVAPVDFIPASSKNWLYYFQSLDFMTMQGITAATTQLNIGTMCNGANLAFDKSAFTAVGGYQGINRLASGDDLFLLQKIKIRFPQQICYIKSKGAIVKTPCQPTLSDFFNQRIRWASKSGKYKDKSMTTILLLVYLLNLSLLFLLIFCFYYLRQNACYFLAFTGILFLKVASELLFLMPVAGFYNKKKELIWFPFLQPLHLLYIVSTGFLGLFTNYKWKGRWVK